LRPQQNSLLSAVFFIYFNGLFFFQLKDGEEVATCPSCSLIVKVIYDADEFLECEEIPASSIIALKQTS
jgi:hypothetical protein